MSLPNLQYRRPNPREMGEPRPNFPPQGGTRVEGPFGPHVIPYEPRPRFANSEGVRPRGYNLAEVAQRRLGRPPSGNQFV